LSELPSYFGLRAAAAFSARLYKKLGEFFEIFGRGEIGAAFFPTDLLVLSS